MHVYPYTAMKKYLFHLIIYWGILVASCSSSKIASSWQKPGFENKGYKSILVMAILNPDSKWSYRLSLEDHMVNDLKAKNIHAISSSRLYGPLYFDDLSPAEALAKVNTEKISAVLTIVLLDQSQDSSYVPGYLRNPTQDDYYMCWWDYYSSVKSRVCTPGYYILDTKYFWETNLYVGPSKEIIYSAQSESFDPGSQDRLAHEYGRLIVKDIKKKKLLQ